MPNKGFGSDIWKNVQAVRFGKDGGIEAPVRANTRDGIVIGNDAIAANDASRGAEARPRPGRLRRLLAWTARR
jgi:hypothetical protein